MSSGPINLHILSKENAIYDWRQLMGPTKVYKWVASRWFLNAILVIWMTCGWWSSQITNWSVAIDCTNFRSSHPPNRAQHEAPDSIRARFGLTDTRNACHGSDSSVTALREIEFFFEDFDVNNWYAKEEHVFRNGTEIVFNPDTFEHEILQRKLRAFY